MFNNLSISFMQCVVYMYERNGKIINKTVFLEKENSVAKWLGQGGGNTEIRQPRAELGSCLCLSKLTCVVKLTSQQLGNCV